MKTVLLSRKASPKSPCNNNNRNKNILLSGRLTPIKSSFLRNKTFGKNNINTSDSQIICQTTDPISPNKTTKIESIIEVKQDNLSKITNLFDQLIHGNSNDICDYLLDNTSAIENLDNHLLKNIFDIFHKIKGQYEELKDYSSPTTPTKSCVKYNNITIQTKADYDHMSENNKCLDLCHKAINDISTLIHNYKNKDFSKSNHDDEFEINEKSPYDNNTINVNINVNVNKSYCNSRPYDHQSQKSFGKDYATLTHGDFPINEPYTKEYTVKKLSNGINILQKNENFNQDLSSLDNLSQIEKIYNRRTSGQKRTVKEYITLV